MTRNLRKPLMFAAVFALVVLTARRVTDENVDRLARIRRLCACIGHPSSERRSAGEQMTSCQH